MKFFVGFPIQQKKNPVFLLVAGPKKEKTEFLYLSKQEDGFFFVPVILISEFLL